MRERKRRVFNQGYQGSLKFGKYTSMIVGSLLIASLFIFASFINSRSVGKQDEINKLSSYKLELEKERERLMFEANRLQSIQEIQKSTNQKTSSRLVPIKEISYLPSSNVALR